MLSARYLKLHQALGLGAMWLKRGVKLVPATPTQRQPTLTSTISIQYPEESSRQPATKIRVETVANRVVEPKESYRTPIKIYSPALPQLAKTVKNCTACILHQSRRQAILGQGNPQAKILIVAESPNQLDDLAGNLFQERAGNLLRNMLQAIQIDLQETYLTTWVKCCPSITLEASQEDKNTCQVYLNAQIQAIRPQVILGLGAHLNALCTTSTTGLSYQNIPMVITHHPERLLRHPQEKAQTYQALIKLKSYLC